MSRINMAVLLVVGLLLVTAKQSMQMSLRNPTAEIETSNCKLTVLRVGLVFTSDHNEKAVKESGLVTNISYVDIAGRRFHVGTLRNTPIVYVKTGTQSVILILFQLRSILFPFHDSIFILCRYGIWMLLFLFLFSSLQNYKYK
ncbi:hypothetical protein OIU85_003961 [Salix viminalis]|uniref:Uncharacterized protein n=1 Tax=Salix viminalis TaxID=40686 RepID=A0A9Q0PRS1_SALVM|nr:hypothetical protein OIU85_003961 [Salix viminalis]